MSLIQQIFAKKLLGAGISDMWSWPSERLLFIQERFTEYVPGEKGY